MCGSAIHPHFHVFDRIIEIGLSCGGGYWTSSKCPTSRFSRPGDEENQLILSGWPSFHYYSVLTQRVHAVQATNELFHKHHPKYTSDPSARFTFNHVGYDLRLEVQVESSGYRLFTDVRSAVIIVVQKYIPGLSWAGHRCIKPCRKESPAI